MQYVLLRAVQYSRAQLKFAQSNYNPLQEENKYLFNRILTFIENVLIDQKLSEYHTGYRAFSKEVLETINYEIDSDDFVFDNEMLSQIVYAGFEIAEITCPTLYFPEASSINFARSSKYGLGVLRVSMRYRLAKWGVSWELL